MTDQPSRWALTRWLVGHTRGLLAPLGYSALARVAGQLLGVALLVVAAQAVAGAAMGSPASVPALVGWLVAIALAKAALRYLEHYAGHWVAFTALQRLRELFFTRLVPQAPAATAGRAGAELTQRATRDIDRIEVFFAHTFPPAISAVVVPVLSLTWLAVTVDAALAAILAAATLAVLLTPILAGGATWASAQRVARRRGDVATHVGDDVQGVREVLAFDAAQARLDGLAREDDQLVRARSRGGAAEGARSAIITAIQLGSLIAVLAYASAAGIPAAGVAVTLAVAVALWGPTRGIEDFVSGLEAAFAATARVREIVEAKPLVAPCARPVPLGEGACLGLEDVTFSYPGASAPALAGVTLRFPEHRWSYLVGVSGSGKSTLAGLALRGWDSQEGVVRFAGVPVRDLALDDLRAAVALVPQRPILLSGTLAENLRLGAPDAPEEALRDAVRVAGLDEWIDGLPDGLDTSVSERGGTVSGGQLQRLALARALVAGPRLLILDEALSQLDADTASLVRGRLAALDGCTILEITHRADLVPGDAPVTVLDAGRVVEGGLAADLRVAKGAFARLQARG